MCVYVHANDTQERLSVFIWGPFFLPPLLLSPPLSSLPSPPCPFSLHYYCSVPSFPPFTFFNSNSQRLIYSWEWTQSCVRWVEERQKTWFALVSLDLAEWMWTVGHISHRNKVVRYGFQDCVFVCMCIFFCMNSEASSII